MRAARLLSLVLLLQNRGRLRAGELAAELGADRRVQLWQRPTADGRAAAFAPGR
ncbi:hypothetical protein [Streptomyces hygroscopicus]|uniref:hypothetical protein n=1 Tax=Streptomyces hygroscopicus TaxID=1912 RepID=UPI001FCA7AB5|nr:hypothetical protein [Streptomyces hygroscopicus]BDH13661.1 hypothetical protein HOK021_48400 [Streptomyces hygroscopicus]